MQNRGATFAVCNGVLLGSLLELLVVRGGAPGTIDAMSIVDSCHAKGKRCSRHSTRLVQKP